jgi:hypothetical protein
MFALSFEGTSSRPALPRTTRSSSPLFPPPPLLPLPPRTRHNPAHHSTSKLLRISRFRTVSVTKGVTLVHPQFSWLLARRFPKSFRIRTFIKCARNSFRMNTSKTQHLKPFRMNTSKKTGRGAWWHRLQPVLFAPAYSFILSPEGPARSGGPLLPYSLTHYSLLTRFSYPGCAVIQVGSLDSNLHSPYSLRRKTSDPATPGTD